MPAVPTIGIGSSAASNGWILMTDDVLSVFAEFTPKFVNRYRNLGGYRAAARQHADEVRRAEFPGVENTYTMPLKKEFSDLRRSFEPLTLYQKFEQVCVLMLTMLIAIIIALALWNLTLKILLSLWATNFDPTDYGVFQTVFGMIFTVIIALEFKRSLLVVAERRNSVVQVRSVILIALLAVVRKLIILDLSITDAFHLLALAAAILALGAVYWLVRDQGQRAKSSRRETEELA